MFYKKMILGMLAVLLTACASTSAVPSTKIAIDLQDFVFAPASITIPANQPVTFTFTNSGSQEHDFVIEKISVTDVKMEGSMEHHMMSDSASEYDLHIATPAGSTSELSFVAAQAGTYKIFCSVPGHKDAGMVGELVVTQ